MTPDDNRLEGEGWEAEFRNRFGNYGLYEDQGYAGFKDVMDEVEAFIARAVADAYKDGYEHGRKDCLKPNQVMEL
jgi:hypothetical protein